MKVQAKIHVLGMVPGAVREVDGRQRRIRSLLAAGWLEQVDDAAEVAAPAARQELNVESVPWTDEGDPPPGSGSGD